MHKQYLKSTIPFVFLKIAAIIVISILYLILASQIQYLFILILGKTKFVYIIGAIASLIGSFGLMSYTLSLIMMFINGVHIASLAYYDKIERDKLSYIQVGLLAFRKHITSIAMIFGLKHLINNLSDKIATPVRRILGTTQIGNLVLKVISFPLFDNTIKDIISSSYDCTIYYLISHTQSGIKDDFKGIIKGLQIYICSLPSIIGVSLSTFILTNFIPKIIIISLAILIAINKGLFEAIFILGWSVPIWFLVKYLILDLFYNSIVLSHYSSKCDSIGENLTVEECDENSQNDLTNILSSVVDLFPAFIRNKITRSNEDGQTDGETSSETQSDTSETSNEESSEINNISTEHDSVDQPNINHSQTNNQSNINHTPVDNLPNMNHTPEDNRPNVNSFQTNNQSNMNHIPTGNLSNIFGNRSIPPMFGSSNQQDTSSPSLPNIPNTPSSGVPTANIPLSRNALPNMGNSNNPTPNSQPNPNSLFTNINPNGTESVRNIINRQPIRNPSNLTPEGVTNSSISSLFSNPSTRIPNPNLDREYRNNLMNNITNHTLPDDEENSEIDVEEGNLY